MEDEEEDKWHFDSADKEEADKDKIDEFIRKIESLEAETFIDPPLDLAEFGLEPPKAKVTIWVKEDEEKSTETTILIGKKLEDEPEKETPEKAETEEASGAETEDESQAEETTLKKEFVYVKNARFDYLFKVDAGFLELIPNKVEDWKKAEEPEEKQ
jgi:septum formation inhibitor MinC